MEKFRVPQRKVAARVLLRDGRELEGALYVPAGKPGGGPGSVTDRLADREESFLPFAGAGGDGCLLSKAWISGVRLARELAGPELPDAPAEHRVRVRLRLAGGAELRGTLPYSMPEEKGRLLDYLNAAPRFVLLQGHDGITLVNREHIVEIDSEAPEG